MGPVDPTQPFGFTRQWSLLGLIPDDLLARMWAEWGKGEDKNLEHYRYWAFTEFLAAHRPLDVDLATALFELGATDSDDGIGGAIMAGIIHLPECPSALLDIALNSGRKHLVRIVERRRAGENKG